ncbi:MAG: hypothetical protein AB7O67_02505 [Vicinamibacterales bacterium]
MSTVPSAPFSRALLLGLALLAGACSGSAATPTSPDDELPPKSQTFSSELAVGGRASRAFPIPDTAIVTATLTAAGPSGTVVGLGFGIPDTNDAHCHVYSSLETPAGGEPQLSHAVEAGTYCVMLWDLGTLTEPIAFSITIEYQ